MTNEQLAFLVVELQRGNAHYQPTYNEVLERANQTLNRQETKEPFYVEKQTSSTKTTKGK